MQAIDEQLDLRGTPCPLNFVRTKLKLQQMAAGQVLEVWLDGGEPVEQVPHSLAMAGFPVAAIEERDGFFALRVPRPALDLDP
jgi:TusA-related sulfurtransferase